MSFKTRQLCLLTTALVTIPAAAFMMTPAYADCVTGAGNTVLCSGTNDTDGFASGSGLTLTNTGITISNPTGHALDLGLGTTIINQTGGLITITAGTGNPVNVDELTLDNQTGGTISSNAGTAIQINSVTGNVSTISNSGTITATGGTPSLAVSDGAGDITITNNSGGAITGDLSLGAGHNVVSLQGGSTLTGNITADAAGNNHLFLGGAGNGTLSSTTTNFPTLVKDGAGTWTLSTANNFSSGITVIQGTLAGGGSILNGTTNNNIDDQLAGTVNFTDTVAGTYAGVISGAGAVTKTGAGTTTITGANSYTGGTTITGGTLKVTNVGLTTALALPGNVDDQGILEFNTANGGTYAGIISTGAGTGNLVKSGVGTLVLSGVNSYNGTTTINDGTLSISAANNLGASSGIVFGGGTLQSTATLTLTQGMSGTSAALLDVTTGTTTDSGIISTAGLTKSGAGTLVLSGVNTYTGSTTINAGTLSVSAANNLGSSTGIVFGGGTFQTTGAGFTVTQGMSGASAALLDINGGGNTTTASGIISTAGLTKNGLGTLVLTGVNTYTGTTAINDGILSVSAANNFGASSGITFAGGSLQTTGIGFTLTQNMDGTGKTIETVGAGNTTTSTGAISGTGGLTKTGLGRLVLSGANTYNGGTTISAGTLEVTNVGIVSYSLPGDVINNATLDFNIAAGGTYAGIISGTGDLVKDGVGTLALGGVNTYTGTTTINAGELSVSAANNLGASSGIIFGGGTLQTTGSGFTVTQDMSGTSDANFNVVGAGNTTTASGVISNTGSLVMNGAGTLVLTGTNTYNGTTALNSGILSVSASNNLGSSSDIWFGGGTLQTTGVGFTITQGMSGPSDANVEVNGAGNTTTSSGIISNTNLNKSGAGTLVLSGINTFSALNINAGEVDSGAANGITDTAAVSVATGATLKLTGAETIGSLSGSGAANLNGFGLTTGDTTNTTFSGVISGAGAGSTLAKVGTGTFTLTGANTYAGLTTVNGGTLTLNHTGGDTLAANNAITVTTGTLSVLTDQAADAVNSAAAGIISVGSGTTLTVGGLGGNSTLSGVVSGAGTIAKSGAGTVDLDAANTISTITVAAGTANLNATNTVANINVNGGALNLTAADVISNTGALTVNGGTVNMNSGDETIGSLAGTGGTIVNNDNTLTVAGVNASPTTYAGVISGAGGLVKTGAGKLALSGTNTYTGDTTVSGGELEVASAGSITSDTTVDAGADLRVNGTLTGAVVNNGMLNGIGTIVGNVTNNATVSPGNSPGIMTITGNYTQTSTGTLAVDIHAGSTPATPVAGTDYDHFNVTGTATLAGTIAATVSPGLYANGATYTLIDTGAGFGGSNFTTITGLPAQGFISFTPSFVNGAGAAQSYVWTVTRRAYSTAATTPNQTATANAFTSAIAGGVANPSSDMASVLIALDGSTDPQAAALFTSANGSFYGSVATANQDMGANFVGSITSRARDSKGGAWVSGNYHWGKGDSTSNEAGADIDNYGISGGVDYSIASNVLGGIAVGYGKATLDGRDGMASADSKGWQIGAYLSFNQNGFGMTGALAYQDTNGDATRHISGPASFSRTATGHPDGKTTLASLEAFYKTNMDTFSLRPFAGIAYNKAKIDGFNESGANALDLNVSKFDPSSTRVYGGIEFGGNLSSSDDKTITPYVRASYSHELSGNDRDIWASFSGGGSAFMVTGRKPSDGMVDLAAGIEASVASNMMVFVGYDGHLRGDQKYHGVNGGFRVNF